MTVLRLCCTHFNICHTLSNLDDKVYTITASFLVTVPKKMIKFKIAFNLAPTLQ